MAESAKKRRSVRIHVGVGWVTCFLLVIITLIWGRVYYEAFVAKPPPWAKVCFAQKLCAQRRGLPVTREFDLGAGVSLRMVLVPPGEFMMGSPKSEKDRAKDERPCHPVRITRPFYIGIHEVTVGQFRGFVDGTGYRTGAETGEKILGWREGRLVYDTGFDWRKPGYVQGDRHPVVCVNWGDAMAFCSWLSVKTGHPFRLPTEAEWEYACRAGADTPYPWGDTIDGRWCNFADKHMPFGYFSNRPAEHRKADDGYAFAAPVGTYPANMFGLYDMIGNVNEWCSDWLGEDYYSWSPVNDPLGPSSGSARVLRGGSFAYSLGHWYCADRMANDPSHGDFVVGFRVVFSP